MIEIYKLKLENGKDYVIIDTIMNDSNKYLILVNEESDDLTVRKVVINNGKECFTKLDNRDEFEIVMTLFYKKHKGDEENEK